MKKFLLLLFFPCTVSAQLYLPPICNGNQCSIYILAPSVQGVINLSEPGQQVFDVPYSALVPPGETRDLHITFTSVGIQGAQIPFYGAAFMTIESPASSGNWKILCRAVDGQNGGWCQNNFNPGVIMTRNDELCLMVPHYTVYPPTESWIGNTVQRKVGVQLFYTIGP